MPTPNLIVDFDFLESVLNAFDEPFYVIRVADYSIVLANHAARNLGVDAAGTQTHPSVCRYAISR